MIGLGAECPLASSSDDEAGDAACADACADADGGVKARPAVAEGTCDRALFDWAATMVSSRAFCLVDSTGRRLVCMAPLHDLANHCVHRRNVQFELQAMASGGASCGAAHCLVARTRISAGEELFLSYGADKSNLLLLSEYGFVAPGNLSDRVAAGALERWIDFSDLTRDLGLLDARMWHALYTLKSVHKIEGVHHSLAAAHRARDKIINLNAAFC